MNVDSTSAFHANEWCILNDSTGNLADVQIQTVVNSTQMTLTANVPYAWTTANSVTIRSLYSGSFDPKSLIVMGSNYVMYSTAFQQFGSSFQNERAVAAISSPLISGWGFDYTRGPVVPLGSVWDTHSAENPSVIAE